MQHKAHRIFVLSLNLYIVNAIIMVWSCIRLCCEHRQNKKNKNINASVTPWINTTHSAHITEWKFFLSLFFRRIWVNLIINKTNGNRGKMCYMDYIGIFELWMELVIVYAHWCIHCCSPVYLVIHGSLELWKI